MKKFLTILALVGVFIGGGYFTSTALAALIPTSVYRDTVGEFIRPLISTDGFRLPSLPSEDCIGTDADGDFQAGTCTGGSGSSEWTDEGGYLRPNETEGIIVTGASSTIETLNSTNATSTNLSVTGVFNFLGTYITDLSSFLFETELDSEAELESQLTDVTNVFTNNDGALADDDLSDNDTGDLAEGSNLYFTTARALSNFISNLAATSSVDSITTLNNLSITESQVSDIQDEVTLAGTPDYLTIVGQVITRGLIDLATDVTGLLDESNIDADIARDSELHSAVTLAGALDYITLSGQQITRNAIDLAADVTGILPDANVANDITIDSSTVVTAPNFTADDNTATSTLPRLSVQTGLNLFGTFANSLDDLCVAITGGSGLCDGTDATGGGGSSLFTDGGATTYLTSTTDNLALGGQATSSPFFMDVSESALYLGIEGLLEDSFSQYGSSTSYWNVGKDVTDNSFAITYTNDLGTSNALTISTGGNFDLSGTLTVGSGNITLTDATGNIDGEIIQADTIDDDSIDFSDVTLADLTFDVGSVDTTEFGFLNGVTSAIQTQLDALGEIAGQIWTGTHDFGGAVLEIPNGTASVADDPGELAHDTSDNMLILDDFVVGKATQRMWAVTVASTSPYMIGGTNLPVPDQLDGYTMTNISCKTVSGTSVAITITDGSNATESITCDSDGATDDGSITNAAVTAGEDMFLDFGTVTGAVDSLSVSVFGIWTRE